LNCYLGPLGVEGFYKNETISGACKNLTVQEIELRYPGEDCSNDNDCFNDASHLGKCTDGKCVGMKENDICNRTVVCEVGNYCDLAQSKCVKQKKEGDACVYGWDCQNNFGCYKGKCAAFGSVKIGEINDAASSNWTFPEDSTGRVVLCETGQLDATDTVCASFNYTGTTASKVNKDGFVECNRDDDCVYTDGHLFSNITAKCQCGYNADGKGYCPLPNGVNVKDWQNAVKNFGSKAKNKCHSVSRFDCYLAKKDTGLVGKEKIDMKKTSQAHLYYNAVPCAADVLSSSYISFSIAALIMIIAFIF